MEEEFREIKLRNDKKQSKYVYEMNNKGEIRNKEFQNMIKISELKSGRKFVKINDEKHYINDLMKTLFPKEEPQNYLLYFKQSEGTYRVLNPTTKEIKTMTFKELNVEQTIKSKFQMIKYKDIEATDEGLLEYAKLFKQWNKELSIDENGIMNIQFTKSYNDFGAVVRYFNYFCKRNYENHEAPDTMEYNWIEACNNYAIQYLDENYIDKKTECFSYDYKQQYAQCLYSDYKISSKRGQEVTLTELPKRKELKHGYYKVHVECDNENFKKIFVYSKKMVYNETYLKYFMKLKKRFNIKFELIQDGQPNAYVYEDEDLVILKSITKNWYETLVSIKKKFPKNPLLKSLLSSAWGRISMRNIKFKTYDELVNENISFTRWEEDKNDYDYLIDTIDAYDNGREVYKLIYVKQPYKYNIRIKSIVNALSKIMTSDAALEDIDNVIRIHTDAMMK